MQLTRFKHESKNYAENLRSTESFRLRERPGRHVSQVVEKSRFGPRDNNNH